jgi:hypothetical protein
MVREFDHLNVYSCANEGSCLHRKTRPAGFVGPASAFVQCEDEATKLDYPVQVWNPVYDKDKPKPEGSAPPICKDTSLLFAHKHNGFGAVKEIGWMVSLIFVFIGLGIYTYIRH